MAQAGRRSAGRRRSTVLSTAATLLVLLAVSAALVALTQPRISVGPPLPVTYSGLVLPKPDPPKLLVAGPPAKAGAIDLVAAPAPVSVAPPDDPTAAALAPLLDQALLRAGDVGVTAISVIDADGRLVYDRDGAAPLLPASTLKLVTAAAALTWLGGDHTFTTTVTTSAPISPEGVVGGDVVVLGGGDPTLVSQAWVDAEVDPDRPHTPITLLADQMVAAGVTSIEGAVVGDDGYLLGTSLADGWPPRYLEDRDATPITGLSVDEGLDLIPTQNDRVRAEAAADPAIEAAAALTEALIERGVVVTGEPAKTMLGSISPLARLHVAQGVLPLLGTVSSPPLMTLLTTMVQQSDNHIADTLFRVVARRAEGTGSFADGQPQQLAVLRELELDFSTSALADGSGLSRANRVPAGLLTALNYRMTQSTVGAEWQELMAVAGVSGTLRRRLPGTIAELRLRGKTGSLGDVRALSGAVVGPDGRPLYFTILSNELQGPQVGAARRLQDLLVLSLAAHLYGCQEIAAPPASPDVAAQADSDLPAYACS